MEKKRLSSFKNNMNINNLAQILDLRSVCVETVGTASTMDHFLSV